MANVRIPNRSKYAMDLIANLNDEQLSNFEKAFQEFISRRRVIASFPLRLQQSEFLCYGRIAPNALRTYPVLYKLASPQDTTSYVPAPQAHSKGIHSVAAYSPVRIHEVSQKVLSEEHAQSATSLSVKQQLTPEEGLILLKAFSGPANEPSSRMLEAVANYKRIMSETL